MNCPQCRKHIYCGTFRYLEERPLGGFCECVANQQDAEASEASTAENRGDTRSTTPSCAAAGGSNVAPPLQLDP